MNREESDVKMNCFLETCVFILRSEILSVTRNHRLRHTTSLVVRLDVMSDWIDTLSVLLFVTILVTGGVWSHNRSSSINEQFEHVQ